MKIDLSDLHIMLNDLCVFLRKMQGRSYLTCGRKLNYIYAHPETTLHFDSRERRGSGWET